MASDEGDAGVLKRGEREREGAKEMGKDGAGVLRRFFNPVVGCWLVGRIRRCVWYAREFFRLVDLAYHP